MSYTSDEIPKNLALILMWNWCGATVGIEKLKNDKSFSDDQRLWRFNAVICCLGGTFEHQWLAVVSRAYMTRSRSATHQMAVKSTNQVSRTALGTLRDSQDDYGGLWSCYVPLVGASIGCVEFCGLLSLCRNPSRQILFRVPSTSTHPASQTYERLHSRAMIDVPILALLHVSYFNTLKLAAKSFTLDRYRSYPYSCIWTTSLQPSRSHPGHSCNDSPQLWEKRWCILPGGPADTARTWFKTR